MLHTGKKPEISRTVNGSDRPYGESVTDYHGRSFLSFLPSSVPVVLGRQFIPQSTSGSLPRRLIVVPTNRYSLLIYSLWIFENSLFLQDWRTSR